MTCVGPEKGSASFMFQFTLNLDFNKSATVLRKRLRSWSLIRRSLKTREHSWSQRRAKVSKVVTEIGLVISMP